MDVTRRERVVSLLWYLIVSGFGVCLVLQPLAQEITAFAAQTLGGHRTLGGLCAKSGASCLGTVASSRVLKATPSFFLHASCLGTVACYRDTSLIRNTHPARITRGPHAWSYRRVLPWGLSYEPGIPVESAKTVISCAKGCKNHRIPKPRWGNVVSHLAPEKCLEGNCFQSICFRGTSLIRNTHPPRIMIGP